MNWKRTARLSWFALPFLLLAIWPSDSRAQPIVPPGSNAVMYEVTENTVFRGEAKPRRVATAALMGTVDAGTPICHPEDATQPPCFITALATDAVSLAPGPKLGQGPVHGTFAVVTNEPGSIDGAEVVVMRGSLRGHINLFQAFLFAATNGGAGSPTGTISGRWRSTKGLHGTFTGTFRIPVDLTGGAGPLFPGYFAEGIGYFPADTATEFSLGVPTVRLELNFVAD